MVKWIVIAVVVLALIILVTTVFSVLNRLNRLDRAARGLQRRQAEAMKLQQDAVVLEDSVAGLQRRAEIMQAQLAIIKAGRGASDGKHSLQQV
jgi:biopolymer transport protein ExbB/TolQ